MNFFRSLVLLPVVFVLAACASSYEDGKSSADVPSHASVIKLQDVYMADGFAPGLSSGDEAKDTNPSQNDQEVVAVVRATAIEQFSNSGYRIISVDQPADISVKISIDYQPERWPLVDRNVAMRARFFDANGAPLFKAYGSAASTFGVFSSIFGRTRDEMVRDAAKEMVAHSVEELRKGTLAAKSPVSTKN